MLLPCGQPRIVGLYESEVMQQQHAGIEFRAAKALGERLLLFVPRLIADRRVNPVRGFLPVSDSIRQFEAS